MVCFSVRPDRTTKHLKKRTTIEGFTDERVLHTFFLLVGKKRRHFQ